MNFINILWLMNSTVFISKLWFLPPFFKAFWCSGLVSRPSSTRCCSFLFHFSIFNYFMFPDFLIFIMIITYSDVHHNGWRSLFDLKWMMKRALSITSTTVMVISLWITRYLPHGFLLWELFAEIWKFTILILQMIKKKHTQ